MQATIPTFALLAALPAMAQPAPPLRSPEIDATGRVTFRLHAPKATEVTISGEFLPGSQPLKKDERGDWSITVGPIEPEIYNYLFTVDGVRTLDPGNPNVKTGSTASTIMNVLEVPASIPSFYDGRAVPHGEIHAHWYDSKSLHTLRRVTVYTPPGYDTNAATRYPVLYLFHGANADETAWTRFGRVNLILDNLIAAGKAKPFVVVMPFGYGIAPGTRGDNTGQFSRDLIEDVIPLIQSKYRVNTSREQRAIAGLSMGGEESLNIGLNHLELFSYVAGFSAALGRTDFEKTYGGLGANAKEVNQKLHLLWIGCGTEDGLFPAAKNFAAFLDEHKIRHTFHQSPGAHTWIVWRHYLNELAPLLF